MQTKKTLLIFLTLMRFFIMTNFTQDVLNSVSKLVPAEKAFGKATATADKARLDTALKLALAVSRMEETLQFEQTQKTEIKKKFFGNPKIEGEKQTYVLTNDQIKNITKITYNPVVLKCAKMSKDVSELKAFIAEELETPDTKGSTDTYRGMVSALPKQDQGKASQSDKVDKDMKENSVDGSYDLIKKIFNEIVKLDLANLKKVFSFITNLENTSEPMISNQDDQDIIVEKLPSTFSHFSKILKDSPINQNVA